MIKEQLFIIELIDDGTRIDVYLTSELNIKRALVQSNITDGKVLVNDKVINKNYRVKENDNVKLVNFTNTIEDPQIIPHAGKIKILYEDEYIIAINKTAGKMITYGIKQDGIDMVVNNVYHYLLQDSKQAHVPLLIHRLDKDTSGVLLLAKSEEAHQAMQALFKNRQVEKRYYAICQGKLTHHSGRIKVPIRKNPNNPRMMIADNNGKEAISLFNVICQNDDLSLCEFQIITGRTHQIRVHAKFMGNAIVGDAIYGSKIWRDEQLMLHAHLVKFTHPFTKESLSITAPLNAKFKTFMKKHQLSLK